MTAFGCVRPGSAGLGSAVFGWIQLRSAEFSWANFICIQLGWASQSSDRFLFLLIKALMSWVAAQGCSKEATGVVLSLLEVTVLDDPKTPPSHLLGLLDL